MCLFNYLCIYLFTFLLLLPWIIFKNSLGKITGAKPRCRAADTAEKEQVVYSLNGVGEERECYELICLSREARDKSQILRLEPGVLLLRVAGTVDRGAWPWVRVPECVLVNS